VGTLCRLRDVGYGSVADLTQGRARGRPLVRYRPTADLQHAPNDLPEGGCCAVVDQTLPFAQ
jgi:hypothetical protein